jgi:sarcosine oxidase, subunit gamma
MAETLARRSPLQDFASRFAATPDAARIAEEPFVAMVDLWVDAEGGAAVAEMLGADATVIWFGPQESLVTSTVRAGEELEAALRDVVTGHGGAAVDVSAQRTTLRLTGTRARDVLATGCSLDLHPRAFGLGATAQTMLGQAAVVLIALDEDGTDYRILVRSSFARHLADWLLDASGEYV